MTDSHCCTAETNTKLKKKNFKQQKKRKFQSSGSL